MVRLSVSIREINHYVNTFAKVINKEKVPVYSGNVKVGVDLGTANIAISVITEENKPLAGALYPASVVKDGIVVDFLQAVDIVEKMKRDMEELLGFPLTKASTAIPPRVDKGSRKVITNVLESALFEVTDVLEETNAAAAVLRITDGAVVDVGGGTTGISILKNNKVIYSADEPTGGTHMSLVLAGAKKIPFEEAEKMKKDKTKEKEVFPIIKPVVEKMAAIIKRHLQGFDDVETIYVVGGASCFSEFTKVFQKYIGIEIVKPEHPLLITPLGIALKGGLNKGDERGS